MIGLQTANPSLMMGRSLAALEDSLRFPGRSRLETLETEVATRWGYDHVASRLPDTMEGAMTATALAAVSTCFPSVGALDACSSDLYVWLVAMQGREGMLALSDALANATACVTTADDATSTRGTMPGGVAGIMEMVCSFPLASLGSTSGPRVHLCEGVLHTEFLQADGIRRIVVAETSIADAS